VKSETWSQKLVFLPLSFSARQLSLSMVPREVPDSAFLVFSFANAEKEAGEVARSVCGLTPLQKFTFGSLASSAFSDRILFAEDAIR